MTITGSDMMASHIDDMDDEPPETREVDPDELYDAERQEALDDAKRRVNHRLDAALLSIGATYKLEDLWDAELPALARKQIG
jgi:hypothetical protein